MANDQPVLRASEIGEYAFCHRAWWLHRVMGIASANRKQMQAGTARHATHGRAVRRADLMERAALVFLALALVLAVFGSLLALR